MVNLEKLYCNGKDGLFIHVCIPSDKINNVLDNEETLSLLIDSYLRHGKISLLSLIDSCKE